MFVIDTMERVWREGGVGGLGPSLEYGAGCAAGHSVLSPPPYHHITPSGTLGPLPRSHQDLGDNVQIWQYHNYYMVANLALLTTLFFAPH